MRTATEAHVTLAMKLVFKHDNERTVYWTNNNKRRKDVSFHARKIVICIFLNFQISFLS